MITIFKLYFFVCIKKKIKMPNTLVNKFHLVIVNYIEYEIKWKEHYVKSVNVLLANESI